jgi:hypothetical protein
VVVLAAPIPCRPQQASSGQATKYGVNRIDSKLAELGHIMRALALAKIEEASLRRVDWGIAVCILAKER